MCRAYQEGSSPQAVKHQGVELVPFTVLSPWQDCNHDLQEWKEQDQEKGP